MRWVMTTEDHLALLKALPVTIACGLHSGFPPCCISFYIQRLFWGRDAFIEYERRMEHRREELVAAGKRTWQTPYGNELIGYVPCPACLAGDAFVDSKRCEGCDHSAENAAHRWMDEEDS